MYQDTICLKKIDVTGLKRMISKCGDDTEHYVGCLVDYVRQYVLRNEKDQVPRTKQKYACANKTQQINKNKRSDITNQKGGNK